MYKDRGLIKWLPFDALNSFFELIEKIKTNKNKIEMPILSEDDYNQMEYNLKKGIENNLDFWIVYYDKGYLIEVISKIKKLNYLDAEIVISNNQKLKRENIYKLEIY